nr:nucleoid-associated protein [uncultured Sphaerochaeta sp.]
MPEERNLEVLNIVVHKVDKEQYKKDTNITLSDDLLDIDDNSKLFLNEFINIYQNPRKTSKSFAQFDKKESENDRFEDLLKEYIENTDSFLGASKKIAKRFSTKLGSESLATGGYVFCVDYKNESKQNFAVIILNQQMHPTILEENGRFKLASSFTLETNSIKMAANIKIYEWKEDSNVSYLSYVRGRDNLTEYFKNFIGCTTAQPAKIATYNVINAVYGFIDSTHENEDERASRKERAKDDLYKIMSTHKEHVTFETVRTHVFSDEDERERFMDYITQNELEISEEFSPDGRVLNTLGRFEYKKRGIDIKIRNEVLKDAERVEFQKDTDFLIIKDPEIKKLYCMQN